MPRCGVRRRRVAGSCCDGAIRTDAGPPRGRAGSEPENQPFLGLCVHARVQCVTAGHAARRVPQLPAVLLPTLRQLGSVVSVSSAFSVVVLLQQQQQQQQQGTEENTEATAARHQEPSSKQHPAVAGQLHAERDPERASASGRSLPSVREATDPPAVQGFAPTANPRTGSARVP